jgi:hypothetical protein
VKQTRQRNSFNGPDLSATDVSYAFLLYFHAFLQLRSSTPVFSK